jgi:hypothetical protein
VRTVPPGSAVAMTRASTADPLLARARSQAALRARVLGTASATSHARRKRCCAASREPTPDPDLLARGPEAVLYAILDAVGDGYPLVSLAGACWKAALFGHSSPGTAPSGHGTQLAARYH